MTETNSSITLNEKLEFLAEINANCGFMSDRVSCINDTMTLYLTIKLHFDYSLSPLKEWAWSKIPRSITFSS